MAKTVVSAFDSQHMAIRILDSLIAGGFDSHLFSIIDASAATTEGASPDSMMHDVPGLQARLYQKHLRMGDSLFVARVSEEDVARLIKLLQKSGGHHIEAFDPVNTSCGEESCEDKKIPLHTREHAAARSTGGKGTSF